MSTSSVDDTTRESQATSRRQVGVFALAGATLLAMRSRTASAVPVSEDASLATIAFTATKLYESFTVYVEKWNQSLSLANKSLATAEKTRDVLQEFADKKTNPVLAQARQIHQYVNTFFHSNRSDFLKSRFTLWDIESQALYRYIRDNVQDSDRVWKMWRELLVTAGDAKAKDETFAQSPKGSAFVAAENSSVDAKISAFQANNLSTQNDRLLDEVAKRPGEDENKAELYAQLSAPIANKTLLEILKVQVQIAESLNDIKFILAGAPVPSATHRKRPTEEDFAMSLKKLKENGTTSKHVPPRRGGRGT